MTFRHLTAALALLVLPAALVAKPAAKHPAAEAQALDLAMQTIALRSVVGPGNQTGDVARVFKDALVGGGWADGDVEIVPLGDTAYLVATWRGSDPKLKPLVLSGHMDVVEAKREDWVRDPFVPVIENGFLYGRGATDMKLDDSLVVASLIELRRQGFRPKRTIVLAFSGDEETAMETGQIIAKRFAGAELVLNVDFDNNGVQDEVTGKPLFYVWQGAEKGYADFSLTVTNPGGHSSEPTLDNAIVQLSQALTRIGAYRFKPEVNDLTREFFATAGKVFPDPQIGPAMRAFAANPADPQAIATLTAFPPTYGLMGTTCVPTMLTGGHAINALPQRATANVNCRIFPGHSTTEIMAELKRVIDMPEVTVADATVGAVATPASPLRPDVKAAIETAIGKVYPGVPVTAGIATGASDNMWFRANGVPSYIVSPLFMKLTDYRSHGLDERTPVANIPPAIGYYLSLFRSLSTK
jgi:acetylornithine deacetylase/succinyl-diaminopimelate desuccinylase-like protein